MKKRFKPGDKSLVIGSHPHSGEQVTLLSYGPYGLSVLNLTGWLVRATDGQTFYCQMKDLEGGAAEPEIVVPEVVAEDELLPTVSPGRRETTVDRLRAYCNAKEDEPVLLTEHQREVLRRYDAAWGLLLEFKTSEDVLGKLMKKFDISRAQAYRDMANCKLLYGDTVKSNREAERYILREMAMTTFGKAKKAGELNEMNKAIANLIKITGIEHADPNIPDAEAFLPSNYTLELKSTGGNDLKLNLEAIAQLPAHEYEEVMDYIQNSGVSEVEMIKKIMESARGVIE